MTDNQQQETLMIGRIVGFAQRHNALIGTFAPLATLFAKVETNHGLLQSNHAIQLGDRKAIGLEKEQMKTTYTAHLNTLLTRSAGYFNFAQKPAEAQQCHSLLSRLPALHENELITVADTYMAIVTPHLTDLAAVKITADRLALLTSQRDTLRNLMLSVASARYESVQATATIGLLLRDTKRLLREELDMIMEAVADENPEVLTEYEALRKVSYRRRKKPVEPEEADPTVATATVKVVDATNGEPIVGATLALDGQPVNDVTDEYGEIDLDNLTLAQHEFIATADGYQAATLQGATTTGGEDYVFELGLEPEGSS